MLNNVKRKHKIYELATGFAYEGDDGEIETADIKDCVRDVIIEPVYIDAQVGDYEPPNIESPSYTLFKIVHRG